MTQTEILARTPPAVTPGSASSATFSRFAQFIGMLGSKHGPVPVTATAQEDEWYLPYNGPYEMPRSAAQASTPGPYSPHSAHRPAATFSGLPETSTSHHGGSYRREDRGRDGDGTGLELEDERGRSRRSTKVLGSWSDPRKSHGSIADASTLAGRGSRVSAPSFLSLDGGGVGESPAPPPRASGVPSSVSSHYSSGAGGGASGNDRWSSFGGLLAIKHRSHQPLPPPLQNATSVHAQSPQQNVPLRVPMRPPVERSQLASVFLAPGAQPRSRALSNAVQSSAPELSAFQYPTGPPRVGPMNHAYNQYGFPSPVYPESPRVIKNKASDSALSVRRYVAHSQPLASSIMFPHLQRDPHPYAAVSAQLTPKPSRAQPLHLHVPESDTYTRSLNKPPGILKGIKSSLSTPNLRAAFNKISTPSPQSGVVWQGGMRGKAHAFEAETWCDVLLPKPRFKAHVISPPPSPMLLSPVPLLMSREPPKQLDVVTDSRRTHKIDASRRLRRRSRSVPGEDRERLKEDLTTRVLRERYELEAARAKWSKEAESSVLNKRSRSLSRSALRSARVRAGAEPAATGTVGTLVAAALSQGRAPTISTASAGGSAYTNHSRTASQNTGSHRRSESWGRSALRRAKAVCADVNATTSPEQEKAEGEIARALTTGGTARLHVQRDQPDDGLVLDIGRSSPTRRRAAVAPPLPPVREKEKALGFEETNVGRRAVTPSPVGIALSTPQPPIVIHSHPYAPHSDAPRTTLATHAGPHPTSQLLRAVPTDASIAARHRLPPRAPMLEVTTPPASPPPASPPPLPPHMLPPPMSPAYLSPSMSPPMSPPPEKRMYMIGRAGSIREVKLQDLLHSPAPSGSPALSAVPLQVEDDADLARRSVAAAPRVSERRVGAYNQDISTRQSMLGVEEVLSTAFRRLSRDSGVGSSDEHSTGFVDVPQVLGVETDEQKGPLTISPMPRVQPLVDEEANEDEHAGAAQHVMELDDQLASVDADQSLENSQLDMLSSKVSRPAVRPRRLTNESRHKHSSSSASVHRLRRDSAAARPSPPTPGYDRQRQSISASSVDSGPSPRPLGSVDDLDSYHDLFYMPGSVRSRKSPAASKMVDSKIQSSPVLSREESGRWQRSSDAKNGGGLAGLSVQLGEELEALRRAGMEDALEEAERALALADDRPLGGAGEGPVWILPGPAPLTARGRTRSGTFGAQDDGIGRSPRGARIMGRPDVPCDVVDVLREESPALYQTDDFRLRAVDALIVPNPMTGDEEDRIHSAHPSLGCNELLATSPATPERSHEHLLPLPELLSPLPNFDSRRPSLNIPTTENEVARSSFVTTTSGGDSHLSLIADFPTPPNQDMIGSSLLNSYFANTPPTQHAMSRNDSRNENSSHVDDEEFVTAAEEEQTTLEDSPTLTHILLSPDLERPPAPAPLPSAPPLSSAASLAAAAAIRRSEHRSTFGGEGELADAWNARSQLR